MLFNLQRNNVVQIGFYRNGSLHSLESLWQCLIICIELKTYIEDSLISNRTTICVLLSPWVSNTSGVEVI